MAAYRAPVRDQMFVLNDVLDVGQYGHLPGFADADVDTMAAILEEGGKFCEGVLAPISKVGDVEGCTRDDDGNVTTPTGWKEAFQQMSEAGWTALSSDPEYGGQGLPHVLNLAVNEMVSSSNMAFGMYPGLTLGAAAALHTGGTDEQKALYLPKMISCQWGGTMNLTEPHCGTDLGMLRTKAVPQADGSYKITGQKIWISSGEHDMAENIVHLVLARIEGAPEGVKGISLFVVPKFIPDADGNPGERNNAKCGGLEHKMGIHGNATCVMDYDEATGWLVGEENKGLKIMFIMMNEARLGVGLQGYALAEAAYQQSLDFAKDRIQGRSLTGPKNPNGPADPIIVHPDVRRMLMDQKSFVEAARCFAFWTALHGDLEEKSDDPTMREKGGDYMALLTPIVKSYLTGKGYDMVSNGLQIHGGSGFTEEWGASQLLRDARITLIYEGTNGVQALDLVGRKLAMNGMRPITTFMGELEAFIAEGGDETTQPFIDALTECRDKLKQGTDWLMNNALENFDHAGAGSHDYLNLFGLTCLTYMWAKMAKVSAAKVAAGDSDPIYANKLVTGRYFIERWVPEAAMHLAKVEAGADSMMELDAEAF
ncbi:acyl-CoA dehydrogenase C-terminal domain-containing protein [Maricaulis sp.]|uniref:acyl-CoA dehydrogenase C-terminal domain-containing protein n=1 Tax=Maricaulis sp. TaxID=1486257 RepID=UPI001B24342B|nr:acyl-CoA dehydrogenase C-terminal domain-containing protein [Maricaulis sp.]MBO6796275.1 acyl-CoA dehydrogenase C-terminal domain-containing protein [Maricaulis sp.]